MSISAVVTKEINVFGLGQYGGFVCRLLFKTLLALTFHRLINENLKKQQPIISWMSFD